MLSEYDRDRAATGFRLPAIANVNPEMPVSDTAIDFTLSFAIDVV